MNSQWNRRSVAVLGVPFDNVTMQEAMALIEQKIDEGGFHQVATANVDFVVHAIADPALQEMLCACDLIVPDGMPIVWASRWMGSRLKERVSGIDLVPEIAKLAVRRGYGIFLLGASDESSRLAAQALEQRFPGLRIVGRFAPPVSSLEEMDHEAILNRIERARPHILLVAMGHPKQEQWLAMHRDRLQVPLCMGVGASIDFLSGAITRAPRWMQRAGLEWLYRAAQEPRRLVQRYLLDACALARHLPAQLGACAIQPKPRAFSSIGVERSAIATVVAISGDLRGETIGDLADHLRRACFEDRHVVLNLKDTNQLGLDAVGFLVHFAQLMKQRERQLWLAEAPAHVRRIFLAAQLSHCFDRSSSVSDALYRTQKSDRLYTFDRVAAYTLPAAAHQGNSQVEALKSLARRLVFVGGHRRVPTARGNAKAETAPW